MKFEWDFMVWEERGVRGGRREVGVCGDFGFCC